MMKIAVVGIGGVGGYFGGLLAKQYHGSDDKIYFIARGDHEMAIRMNGLQLKTTSGTFTVHPAVVTEDPGAIGPVDLVLFCTKGYSLAAAAATCKSIIVKDTILLPLLNGVDASERLEKIFPENEVWNGCVYLVSRLAAPGQINETGNIRKLFFGAENGSTEKLKAVEKFLIDAGIDAKYAEPISETTWEKFLFISPMATLTSFLDLPINEIFADPGYEKMLESLVREVYAVALAKNLRIQNDVTTQNLAKMKSLPAGSTTSMHSDFRKGGKTELESLTGYVIREASRLRIPVPTYESMYEKLKSRQTFTG